MSTIQSYLTFKSINDNINTTLNNIFGEFLKQRAYSHLELQRIKSNVFMQEKFTDLLGIIKDEETNALMLKENGYMETMYDEYISTNINAIISDTRATTVSVIDYSDKIICNSNTLTYGFAGDHIFFMDTSFGLKVKAKYEVDEIKDFKIDDLGFVYLAFVKDEKSYIMKSHISMGFFHVENYEVLNNINKIESIFLLEVDKEIESIIYTGDNLIYYKGPTGEVRKVELGRKYFFRRNSSIYFNADEKWEGTLMQIEHLHFYDWISLLGLNTFKSEEGLKLSTRDTNKFKDLLRFKFDDTANGSLNYFDFYKNKDYRVDVDYRGIEIVGNFLHNYENGDFLIKLNVFPSSKGNEVELEALLYKGNKCLKRVKGKTVQRLFYFCNLKFQFYSYSYSKRTIELPVSINDEYSFMQMFTPVAVNMDVELNNFEEIASRDQVLFNEKENKKELVKIDYDDGNIVVRNFAKDSVERAFARDLKIKMVTDNEPTLVWRQLKDMDYFLSVREFSVEKKLTSEKKSKPLMSSKSETFTLNLEDMGFKKEEE